jgi:hypothetical protein
MDVWITELYPNDHYYHKIYRMCHNFAFMETLKKYFFLAENSVN